MDSSRQLGLLYIFVGSGLGGVVRYGLAMGVRGVYNKPFPMGTFVVNVVACLLMGFLVGMADQKQLLSPAGRLFWTVGFCGGFSTFSAFGMDIINLLKQGNAATAAVYMAASVVVCLLALAGGLQVAARMA